MRANPADLVPGVTVGQPFYRRCDARWHPGASCAAFHVQDVPLCLLRCAQVYAPVHILPVLLFRFGHTLRHPWATTKSLASAVLASSAFLTTYVTVVKLTVCALRTTRHTDAPWHAAVAGALSALGLGFENEKRVSELMLYCAPKAVDVLWQLLERRGLVTRVRFGEGFLFACAAAILLSLDRTDFRPTYARLLDFLFGAEQYQFHTDPADRRIPAQQTDGEM